MELNSDRSIILGLKMEQRLEKMGHVHYPLLIPSLWACFVNWFCPESLSDVNSVRHHPLHPIAKDYAVLEVKY